MMGTRTSDRALLGVIVLILTIVDMESTSGLVAQTMPPSSRVRELNIWTFQGSVRDSRLWLVKFYVPWCRGCKRMMGQYDELAEAFELSSEVVVARFDCMQNEDLCDRLGVDRTPTLKLFLNGTVVETYKADFYHVELMVPFLRKMLEKYKGVKQSKTQEDAAAATLESGSNASVTTSPEAASGPAGSAGTGPVYGEVKVQPDDVIQATPLETDVYYSPAGATSSEFGGDNDGEGGGAKVQSDNQLDMPTASGKWAKPDRAEDAILLEVAAAVAANVPDGSDGDPVGGCGGDRGGGEPVIRRGRRGGLAVETLQREREEL